MRSRRKRLPKVEDVVVLQNKIKTALIQKMKLQVKGGVDGQQDENKIVLTRKRKYHLKVGVDDQQEGNKKTQKNRRKKVKSLVLAEGEVEILENAKTIQMNQKLKQSLLHGGQIGLEKLIKRTLNLIVNQRRPHLEKEKGGGHQRVKQRTLIQRKINHHQRLLGSQGNKAHQGQRKGKPLQKVVQL